MMTNTAVVQSMAWNVGLAVWLSACSDGRDELGADGADGISDATGFSGGAEAIDTSDEGDGEPESTDHDDGAADDDPGDGDGDGDDPGNGEGGVKWDTIAVPDAGPPCGAGWGSELEFSYLWAANSSQGTISKIDTKTVTETGRYMVRPDSAGSPSRTSVSLTGHVAVANRNGGVTKIYADEKYCKESNGIP